MIRSFLKTESNKPSQFESHYDEELTLVVRKILLEVGPGPLLLEEICLVEEKDKGGMDKPRRVTNGGK
jgi:hypothetical protein